MTARGPGRSAINLFDYAPVFPERIWSLALQRSNTIDTLIGIAEAEFAAVVLELQGSRSLTHGDFHVMEHASVGTDGRGCVNGDLAGYRRTETG